ncbi:hypothetical protein BaRGS_00032189, partial [Batillaria attramentaria]
MYTSTFTRVVDNYRDTNKTAQPRNVGRWVFNACTFRPMTKELQGLWLIATPSLETSQNDLPSATGVARQLVKLELTAERGCFGVWKTEVTLADWEVVC